MVLFVGGLYLIEAADHRGSWYMGEERGDGVVECWGNYGPLTDALRGL
jgi:hypothetical protein